MYTRLGTSRKKITRGKPKRKRDRQTDRQTDRREREREREREKDERARSHIMVRCESCSEVNGKMERIYSWPYAPQQGKEINEGGCE